MSSPRRGLRASLSSSFLLALLALLTARAAAADESAPPVTAMTTTTTTSTTTTASAATSVAPARRHTIYVEALGKGGLWGVGYDVRLTPRLGVGAAASFYVLDGQRVLSLSPYLSAYPLGHGHHFWYVHLGPQLFNVHTPSAVPEWSGKDETGLGVELSTGYEYRGRVVLRAGAMATVGRGGFAPWLGVSVGWAL